MKVIWSEEARAALLALEERLARRYSGERAADLVDALVERVARLEDNLAVLVDAECERPLQTSENQVTVHGERSERLPL